MIYIGKLAKKYLQKILLITVIATSLFVTVPITVQAEGELLTVSPLVFDEKTKIRDILKKNLTITNNTNRKLDVYTFVNNIDVMDGEQAFQTRSVTDVSESLANWIEISRANIELEPGQTKQIPFLIHVSVYAKPGIHHAQISFGWGSTQVDAQAKAEREPSIMVNVEVLDDSREMLQLGTFIPDKTFFTDNIASFSYLFENIGNRAVSPTGEIRIYNRRGEEMGAVDVNKDGAELLPNMTSELASMWNSDGKFGRYKAILDIEYGDKQRGTVQDTIFFWILPWKKILSIFMVLSVVISIGVFLLHRRYELYQEYKFASIPLERNQVTNTPQQFIPQRQVVQPPIIMSQSIQQTAKAVQSTDGAIRLSKRMSTRVNEGNVVRLKPRT